MLQTFPLKLKNLSYYSYTKMKESGMFWEMFPETTGNYFVDVKMNKGDIVTLDYDYDRNYNVLSPAMLDYVKHNIQEHMFYTVDEQSFNANHHFLHLKEIPGRAFPQICFRILPEQVPVNDVHVEFSTSLNSDDLHDAVYRALGESAREEVLATPIDVKPLVVPVMCHDINGVLIGLGDRVVYGTSGNGNLKIGTIVDCHTEVKTNWHTTYPAVKVQADGSKRAGVMPSYNTSNQMMVIK